MGTPSFPYSVRRHLHYVPTPLADLLLQQVDPGGGYSLSHKPSNYRCIGKGQDKLAGEGLFDIGNDGDLAIKEEDVFRVLATDTAVLTIEGT